MALPASEIRSLYNQRRELDNKLRQLAEGTIAYEDRLGNIVVIRKIDKIPVPWEKEALLAGKIQVSHSDNGVMFIAFTTSGELNDYCSANDLCPKCGTENEETDAGKHCPNHCWGEVKEGSR